MSQSPHTQIRVMSATGLRAVNLGKGNSDPYVVLSLPRTGETKTTTICLNTCNPMWYHNVIFNDVKESDLLAIRIYDKNLISGDVDVGDVQIPLGEALSASNALLSRALYQYSPGGSRASTNLPPSSPPPSQPSDGHHHDVSSSSTGRQCATAKFSRPSTSHGRTQLPNPAISSNQFAPQSNVVSGGRDLEKFSCRSRPMSSNSSSLLCSPRSADANLQRAMTRIYSVHPQGDISVVVAPGWLSDLAGSAPRNQFKRFQIHKFAEQVGNIGKIPFQNRVGHSVGHALKVGAEKVKPLHAALDLLQPVHAVFQEHSTWKITMRDVSSVFGAKRHGWNRDYPAAQKIFQGPGSLVSRRLVQVQHDYLYGGASGIKPLVHLRKDLLEVTGNILDAQDFLDVMQFGIRRGKPRMFTYVLMPDRLYLAETGAKFFRDIMSKHAMHCSASPEVVYAGELHFRQASRDWNGPHFKLVLDNNSGTYAPGKEDLPLVEEVFRRNFPGLDVTALDFRDPLLMKYTSHLVTHSALEPAGGSVEKGGG